MRIHDVRVHKSDENLAREDQLAWRIAEVASEEIEPTDAVADMVINRIIDNASVAVAHHVSRVLNRRVGPSTGTNICGAFALLSEMVAQGRSGSVVTLLADSGDRYTDTYFCDEWLTSHGIEPAESAGMLAEFERSGRWS